MSKISDSAALGAAADAIRRIVQVVRESSAAIERSLGISGAQLFVLRALADGEAASLNHLAARVQTHQSSVSVVAGKLVDRGLVERKRSASDGRQVALAITASGRRLLRGAPVAAQELLIAGLRRMKPPRRRALALALGELVAAMGAEVGTPPMLFAEQTERQTATAPRRRR